MTDLTTMPARSTPAGHDGSSATEQPHPDFCATRDLIPCHVHRSVDTYVAATLDPTQAGRFEGQVSRIAVAQAQVGDQRGVTLEVIQPTKKGERWAVAPMTPAQVDQLIATLRAAKAQASAVTS